jgi:hypothetical protein
LSNVLTAPLTVASPEIKKYVGVAADVWAMSPARIEISTTYKTRLALEAL